MPIRAIGGSRLDQFRAELGEQPLNEAERAAMTAAATVAADAQAYPIVYAKPIASVGAYLNVRMLLLLQDDDRWLELERRTVDEML